MNRLLTEARELLDRLADALLRDETGDQEDMFRLLGPRPEAPIEGTLDVIKEAVVRPIGEANNAV